MTKNKKSDIGNREGFIHFIFFVNALIIVAVIILIFFIR